MAVHEVGVDAGVAGEGARARRGGGSGPVVAVGPDPTRNGALLFAVALPCQGPLLYLQEMRFTTPRMHSCFRARYSIMSSHENQSSCRHLCQSWA